MLISAASIPSAPVLVEGVGRGLGEQLMQLRAGVQRVALGLPDADVVVIVAAGEPALHDTAVADLSGLGYPGHRRTVKGCPAAIAALSRMTQYPRVRRPRLPVDLATLTLLLDRNEAIVALEVSAAAEFAVLRALGVSVVEALHEAQVVGMLVVSGDLSAGLTPRAPLAERPGAVAWDATMVELFTDGDGSRLAALGPAEAERVGARGWAPLCVLHGATASVGMEMAVRRYAAPRGAGYLVMSPR